MIDIDEALNQVYIDQTSRFLQKLEAMIERNHINGYSHNDINESLRIMHTIKGSSEIMLYHELSNLAHSIEDLLSYFREHEGTDKEYKVLSFQLINSIFFIRTELEKIKNGKAADGQAKYLIKNHQDILSGFKMKTERKRYSYEQLYKPNHVNVIKSSKTVEQNGLQLPLRDLFVKMNYVVSVMAKRLNKDVTLEFIGDETMLNSEYTPLVYDCLLHLILNAIDHGIETEEERKKAQKPIKGTITLEGKKEGNNVRIKIKDDGKGIDKKLLAEKARKLEIIDDLKQSVLDDDLYNLVFIHGFSVKDRITKYSGRGIGLAAVSENLKAIGGKVYIESLEGEGTTIVLRVPNLY